MKTCLLCKKSDNLCNSHIFPQFFIGWLKKTSITGYLRNAYNINLRVQDGTKMPLLCANCVNKINDTMSLNVTYTDYLMEKKKNKSTSSFLKNQFVAT